MKPLLILLAAALGYSIVPASAAAAQIISVPATLWRLADEEDTDHDLKITIHDAVHPFEIRDTDGAPRRTVTNVSALSILFQNLRRAEENHRSSIAIDELNIDENIVDRTHRLIKEFYWDSLTRRIDAANLFRVLPDSKTQSKYDYLYVPDSDEVAYRYFKALEKEPQNLTRSPALKVVRLPPSGNINGSLVRNLDGEHGLLSLKLELNAQGIPTRGVPYIVPGGRFNELYYWDSYFIVLGLLEDGRIDLARGVADNLIYEIEHYGLAPNGNRTYYLTRSQPPFLTSIIRAIYDAKGADKNWLKSALRAAITEYQNVWMGHNRIVPDRGRDLSRYFDSGDGPCPEVEPGHYDEKIAPWMQLTRGATDTNPADSPGKITPYRFLNEFVYCGQYGSLSVRGVTLREFFKHDRALRESGHDTTHRFADRTEDYLPVDLNALLYKYERDLAELLDQEFGGNLPDIAGEIGHSSYWNRRALARKEKMLELMWDERQGFFFDYDFVNQKRSSYISCAGLFPLWAKVLEVDDPEQMERARRIVGFTKSKLEQFAGLAATARESVESATTHDPRQWDYPFGWPPHQMLAWQGLKNYGFTADAERLAYRWLFNIARNARDFNGTIPEKYNVVTGSHEMFVEYGNVGTKFDYITPEGFGWMNASFQFGPRFLSPTRLDDLKNLRSPSEVSRDH